MCGSCHAHVLACVDGGRFLSCLGAAEEGISALLGSADAAAISFSLKKVWLIMGNIRVSAHENGSLCVPWTSGNGCGHIGLGSLVKTGLSSCLADAYITSDTCFLMRGFGR